MQYKRTVIPQHSYTHGGQWRICIQGGLVCVCVCVTVGCSCWSSWLKLKLWGDDPCGQICRFTSLLLLKQHLSLWSINHEGKKKQKNINQLGAGRPWKVTKDGSILNINGRLLSFDPNYLQQTHKTWVRGGKPLKIRNHEMSASPCDSFFFFFLHPNIIYKQTTAMS